MEVTRSAMLRASWGSYRRSMCTARKVARMPSADVRRTSGSSESTLPSHHALCHMFFLSNRIKSLPSFTCGHHGTVLRLCRGQAIAGNVPRHPWAGTREKERFRSQFYPCRQQCRKNGLRQQRVQNDRVQVTHTTHVSMSRASVSACPFL